MSTQYEAVKKAVHEEVEAIQKRLEVIQSECIEKIQMMSVSTELEEQKDDLIEKISNRFLFYMEPPGSASVVIGTARSGHFSWRTDNGFRDLSSFERWLSTHPEFSIIDEYGTPITLEEFKEIVVWCGR